MNHRKTSFSGRISRAAALGLVLCFGLSIAMDDAQARRLGSGKGFGRQSSNVTQPPRDTGAMSKQPPAQGQQPTQGQQAGQQASPASAAQPPARSRWGGILGGLVAGLGIAALLSHFGLGGAFAGMLGSVIMIALLVLAGLFVLRMLRGTPRAAPSAPVMEPATQPAISALRSGEALPGSVAATLQGAGASGIASPAASSATWAIPAEFDTEAFLRSAKVHFLRLQAAWDKRDLDDIREFTTPEVFAEIRMQMSEDHGGGRVDIEPLEAQLLGIETTDRDYLASVRFSGMEREGQKPPEPFVEVWNLCKPLRGNQGWLLAGIQQTG